MLITSIQKQANFWPTTSKEKPPPPFSVIMISEYLDNKNTVVSVNVIPTTYFLLNLLLIVNLVILHFLENN